MFHNKVFTKYIFVNGTIDNGKKFCWHELKEGGEKPEVCYINDNSFTGKLTGVEIKLVEVHPTPKTKKIKHKLDLFFVGQDGNNYVIRSGIQPGEETTFARGVLLKLNELVAEDFANEITLTVSSPADNEKVVFVSVFVQDKYIKAEWNKEADLELIVKELQYKLNKIASSPKEATDDEPFDDSLPF